jgi:hypothetical protein
VKGGSGSETSLVFTSSRWLANVMIIKRTTNAYNRPSRNCANYLATTPEPHTTLAQLGHLDRFDSGLGVFVKDIDHSLLELSSRDFLHEQLVELCWTPVLGFWESEIGPESAEESTSGPKESGSSSPCFVSLSHEG